MEPGGDESGEDGRGLWSNLTLCMLTSSHECVFFLYSIKYYALLLRGNLSGMAVLHDGMERGEKEENGDGNFH